MMKGYLGGGEVVFQDDGAFQTSDLAHIEGDELFVVGRSDDVFVIAGRNIHARDLDAIVDLHPSVRPGNCAAILVEPGQYAVIAEPRAKMIGIESYKSAGQEIRRSLAKRISLNPSEIVFVERGSIPKTPSGKIRRKLLARQWQQGQLVYLARV
jgi:acyl-CoA synthetase (AMP-forming)/AMP-acid ligase II